jgi:hypothetical protein
MDSVDKYPFVAMVEVVKKDTVSGEQLGSSKSFVQSTGYSFTVVKILKQYSGKYLGEEIKVIDSKGFECFTKLFYKNIGDKFIVKGGIEDINEYIFTSWEKPLPKQEILVLWLCDTNQLQLDEKGVTGWITKNSSHKWWRCSQFLKKISFGLINREKKGWKEFQPQQMKIEEFERKLKFKVKKSR